MFYVGCYQAKPELNVLRITFPVPQQPGMAQLDLHREDVLVSRTSLPFTFRIKPQDAQRMEWYFEEYRQQQQPPADAVARGIERKLTTIGHELFQSLFSGVTANTPLSSLIHSDQEELSIEIVTGTAEAETIPWELITPPDGLPLALRSKAFVRVIEPESESRIVPSRPPRRILLAVCRPFGDRDVPYRSIATELLKHLRPLSSIDEIKLLRPATYDALVRTLQIAFQEGRPYDLLHFDGHGAYLILGEGGGPSGGSRGYVAFEGVRSGSPDLVDGATLGALLVNNQVPLLILNACRSGFSIGATEGINAPITSDFVDTGALISVFNARAPGKQPTSVESHQAWGSLAQEVVSTGVGGAVAMRYDVFVDTAVTFMKALYSAIGSGNHFATATTFARQRLLRSETNRALSHSLGTQDWVVPVVYARPFSLNAEKFVPPPTRSPSQDPALGPDNTCGFYGRHEVVLALDRAFDAHQVVSLQGEAGGGKTACAIEFGRWYRQTGGIYHPVLFTHFGKSSYTEVQLNRVLSGCGINRVEASCLASTVSIAKVMRTLASAPTLWIWDGVDYVSSSDAAASQRRLELDPATLAEFLARAISTGSRFLLTARSEDQGLVGRLASPVSLKTMRQREVEQIAECFLSSKHLPTDLDSWKPVLHRSSGNPRALTQMMTLAASRGALTLPQVVSLIEQLDDGLVEVEDAGVVTGSAFHAIFSESDRKQLALLHMFRSSLNLYCLVKMAELLQPELECDVLTEQSARGLLLRAAHAGYFYPRGPSDFIVAPVSPSIFRHLYAQYYDAREGRLIEHSYIRVMIDMLSEYLRLHEAGTLPSDRLRVEQSNVLHVYSLARVHGEYATLGRIFSILERLYADVGTLERDTWRAVLKEAVADCVDPTTKGPLPGKEEAWFNVNLGRIRWGRATGEDL